MKRLLLLFSFCLCFFVSEAQVADNAQPLYLQVCAADGWGGLRHSVHRTPLRIPDVFFDKETGILF